MHEEIKAKLSSISDLEERAVFKDVLTHVFLSLYNNTQRSFYELENRVYSEMLFEDNYNIFGTVAPRREVDLSSDFFFPMNPEKMEVPIYNFYDVKNRIIEGEPFKLFEVFFDCNYIDFYNLIASGRTFTGIISTDYREYRATFEISQNFEYISMTEDLYNLFSANSVEWKTINLPYLWRFVDVNLVNYSPIGVDQDEEEIDLIDDEEIRSISVDFEEYTKIAKYDMVPLWNIASYDHTLKSAPIPVDDIVNYEHVIDINDIDSPGGILIDFQNMEIPNIRRTQDEIIVTLNTQKSQWELYNIVPAFNKKFDDYDMPITSNEKKPSFIQSFSNIKSKNIKTRSELIRLVNSFDIESHLELVDFEIVDYKASSIGIYLNYFIEDEIRDMSSKKSMVLKFEPEDYEYNFNEDIMNFLVSEVQLYFPEYICVGEIV